MGDVDGADPVFAHRGLVADQHLEGGGPVVGEGVCDVAEEGFRCIEIALRAQIGGVSLAFLRQRGLGEEHPAAERGMEGVGIEVRGERIPRGQVVRDGAQRVAVAGGNPVRDGYLALLDADFALDAGVVPADVIEVVPDILDGGVDQVRVIDDEFGLEGEGGGLLLDIGADVACLQAALARELDPVAGELVLPFRQLAGGAAGDGEDRRRQHRETEDRYLTHNTQI